MSITEKVAYLKGLVEGMEISEDSKEGKLLKAIMDVLADLALDMEDVQDNVAELTEQVDAVDEDLDALEKDYYEDEEDEDDEFYDITCPGCQTEFSVDEDTLLDGGIDCPNCGEHLEFDIDCCEEEDGNGGCGCGCHDEDDQA